MSAVVRPLHVVESWPPVRTGYTTRSAALVAAQERSGDLRPRVLVTSRQSVYGQHRVDEHVAGADLRGRVRLVASSPRERRARHVRRFAVDAAALERAAVAAVAELGADLVHVHWSSGIGAAAAAAARRCRLPLVAEVRFDLAGAVTAQTARLPLPAARATLEDRLRRVFERHLSTADAVVSASPTLAGLLEDTVPALRGRVVVAANGCEPHRFAPGPPDRALQAALGLTGRTVVGTTSTMLRYEGLDLLLDAAGRLRGAHPDLSVLLVGDGPERQRLASQAARLGVHCVQTGPVPPERVPEHYRLLDVMVLPRRDAAVTRYSGPVKLLEAMAAGRACLASAVGDIPALLAAERGVLVPAGDVGALGAALDALLGDAAARDRHATAARRWATGAGTWDAAAAAHRAVYAGLPAAQAVPR